VTVERRVIMLSHGGRLATFAFQALGNGCSMVCLESPVELADWTRPPVDVVLLDLPRHHRGIVYRQLRQRYRGPVLALLDDDDDGGGLPADRGPLAILSRPFSGDDLSDALGRLLAPPDQVRLPTPEAVDSDARHAAETAAETAAGSAAVAVGSRPEPPSPSEPPGPPGPPGQPAARPMAGHVPAGARPWRARRASASALAGHKPRRRQIVVVMSALLVLSLSLGAQSGCRSRCGVAGAADGSSAGTFANSDVGPSPQPPTSGSTFTGSTVATSGAVAAISGPASGTSTIGALMSSGSPSLLDSAGSEGSIIGAALVGPTPPTLSPLSDPTTARPATTASPATTKPPATTAAPTTAPTTTAPPATTAAPTTAPTTTAPPATTEPPTTTGAGLEQP
jgi:hypothetical protein